MTISADWITFTDDGHAWLVGDTFVNGKPYVKLWENSGFTLESLERREDPAFEIEVESNNTCYWCNDPDQSDSAQEPDDHEHDSITIRVSVVPGMVLPIVRGACPDKTNAPHRRAHVHLAEPSDDDQSASGICHENCDLIFDSPWKSKNAALLPSAAAAGQWAAKLRVAS